MQTKINNSVKELRKNLAEKSIKVFARFYFEHYRKKPDCPMHEELYQLLFEMTEKRGERAAVAAPRDNAKSSIASLIYVLWCVCFRKEKYILLLSETKDQAADNLSHIKSELENNQKLIEDFPEVCMTEDMPKPECWKKSEIITRNGVKITSLGSGQKIRGRRHKEERPSLIIADDIEGDEHVIHQDMRQKTYDWFTKAVLKAGSPKTNVIVIGTLLHYDSLLAKLLRDNEMHGWRKKKYKAIISWSSHPELWQKWSAIFNFRDTYHEKSGKEAAYAFYLDNKEAMLEGTKVLWPEMEDYYALMEIREQEGEWSFDSEKQNEPVNSKERHFNPDEFSYWDKDYSSVEALLSSLGANLDVYGACDPSLGKPTKQGDYSAIVSVARDKTTGIIYVIDADIAKRLPDKIVKDIIEYCRIRNYVKFIFETNQFQEVLVGQIQDQGAVESVYPAIEKLQNTTDKTSRIQSLQAMIKSGKIKFSKKHTELLVQLGYFPKGPHDDGPDALEMAVRTCRLEKKKDANKVTFVDLEGSIEDDEPTHERIAQDPNARNYGKQYDDFLCDEDDD